MTLIKRTPITFAQLEQKVRQLAADNPDFIYPQTGSFTTCVYNATGHKPSCIFGRAFAELGHPVPEKCEGSAISPVATELLADGENLTSQQKWWLDRIQSRQDRGERWLQALADADELRKNMQNESTPNEESLTCLPLTKGLENEIK